MNILDRFRFLLAVQRPSRERAPRQHELNRIVKRAINRALKEVRDREPFVFRHMHYGAVVIDPRHLVIWYIYKTDADLDAARSSGPTGTLVLLTRDALRAGGYPASSVDDISVNFTSYEDVQRKTGGNYFQYFK